MTEGKVTTYAGVSAEIVNYLGFDWTSDGLELTWINEDDQVVKLGYVPWNIVATYIKEYL